MAWAFVSAYLTGRVRGALGYADAPSRDKSGWWEPCAAEARGVLSTMRARDWRVWLLGAAVFAASIAFVVFIALLLLGIFDLGLG